MTQPFVSAAQRGLRSPAARIAAAVAVAFGALMWHGVAQSGEDVTKIPAPTVDEKVAANHSETAVFAGGCFWGVQGVFQHVRGVTQVASGYTGGAAGTAQYETVSEGDTGHAESVRIVFDPTQITYGHLLQIFFSVAHNPTELDYQGPDHGTQYRSAIFPMDADQRHVAEAYIAQLNASHAYSQPLVTSIEAYKGFYPAENYHQNFLALHPDYPYIAINDMPKVGSLKKMFPNVYRDQPVLLKVSGT
ncbi:peptide-methionine (S)-S-oxide reductase MsrA [Paraburkholderia sp.]|uniref:peptide-methionine (S)-S-oxide reductase MsrA n=1 Tax=Paraburkholderia sp. TaxID=1926495 RepID=UPI003D6E1F0A